MAIDRVMWAPDGQGEGGKRQIPNPRGLDARTFTRTARRHCWRRAGPRARQSASCWASLVSKADLRALVKAAKERQAVEQTEA